MRESPKTEQPAASCGLPNLLLLSAIFLLTSCGMFRGHEVETARVESLEIRVVDDTIHYTYRETLPVELEFTNIGDDTLVVPIGPGAFTLSLPSSGYLVNPPPKPILGNVDEEDPSFATIGPEESVRKVIQVNSYWSQALYHRGDTVGSRFAYGVRLDYDTVKVEYKAITQDVVVVFH